MFHIRSDYALRLNIVGDTYNDGFIAVEPQTNSFIHWVSPFAIMFPKKQIQSRYRCLITRSGDSLFYWSISLYQTDSRARLEWLDNKVLLPRSGCVMHRSIYWHRLNEWRIRH